MNIGTKSITVILETSALLVTDHERKSMLTIRAVPIIGIIRQSAAARTPKTYPMMFTAVTAQCIHIQIRSILALRSSPNFL